MRNFWLMFGFGLLSVVMCSCKPNAYNHTYREPVDVDTIPYDPQLLFVTFKIRQDSNASVISLLEKQLVKGTLKSNPEISNANDRIYVVQLTRDKTELLGYYIDHPLRKSVESVNDQQEFSTRWIELQEADFFVRIALEPTCVYLGLYEVKGTEVVKSFFFNVNQ